MRLRSLLLIAACATHALARPPDSELPEEYRFYRPGATDLEPCGSCTPHDLKRPEGAEDGWEKRSGAWVTDGVWHQKSDFRGDAFGGGRWGNRQAAYWMSRALSALGGLSFKADALYDFQHTQSPWLYFLPNETAAGQMQARRNCTAFREECLQCGWDSLAWSWPSKCFSLIATFADVIHADTTAAMERWAKLAHRRFPGAGAGPEDVVIHSRCSGDTWLDHEDYGQTAFSHYDVIPENTTGAVVLVCEMEEAINHRGCALKTQALLAHLRGRLRLASFVGVKGGDVFDDYATMVTATTLIRDAGSTLSFWAGVAGAGTVWTPGTWKGQFVREKPMEAMARFRYTNTKVAYPRTLGSEASKLTKADSDVEAVVEWLKAN